MLSNESFMRLLYRQEESESIVTGIRTMINGIIRTCFGLYFPQTNGLTQPATQPGDLKISDKNNWRGPDQKIKFEGELNLRGDLQFEGGL